MKKAASVLRAYDRGEIGPDEWLDALAVVAAYRKQFSYPLLKVNNGLRSFCKALDLNDAVVSQRLKREETIIEKLTKRETSMNLLTMQDIGGCRVILGSRSDLRALHGRIQKSWSSRIIKVDDYIADPRASGYRAVHIIVETNGMPIEVQLRTQDLHDWAETVESFGGRSGLNYKQDGDRPIQRLMAVFSKIDQYYERDEVPPSDLFEAMRILGEAAREDVARQAEGTQNE
ncbi:MAG: hypothetical protein Q4G64_00795 [bacterium]|nr:hypothetical protein [bacterium]